MQPVGTDISSADGTQLRVWEAIPEDATEAVLFTHGAITSSKAIFAPPVEDDSYSWFADVTNRGKAAFAVDIRGYGYSERHPKYDEPPENNDPVSRAPEAAQDAAAALSHVADQFDVVHYVTISWGTLYTGALLTGEHTDISLRETATSLTLCAPVYEPAWDWNVLAGELGMPTEMQAYFVRDKEMVRAMQSGPESLFEASWSVQIDSNQGIDEETYLAPMGAQQDILKASKGNPPYDISNARAPPTLILRGSEDVFSGREDALDIYENLDAAGHKEYVELDGTDHYLNFEESRGRTFNLVDSFQEYAKALQ